MATLPPSGSLKEVSPADKQLMEILGGFVNSPLELIRFIFPWGEGELQGQTGPDEWQTECLTEIGRQLSGGMSLEQAIRMAVSSGHGIGKRQANSLIVETFSGPMQWGDVREGTLLIGRNGKPTKVVMSHPDVVRPLYKVTFDDGTSTLADGEHLWNVKGRQERRNGLGWITLTTEQILAKGVKRSNGSAQARQWEIPQHEAVEWPKAEQEVSPYLMGVYIGNGSHTSNVFVTGDLEVVAHLEELGYPSSVAEHTHNSVNVNVPGLHKAIVKSPLKGLRSYEKFIPDNYKYADVEQRWELLRGLMDTDGTATQDGQLQYTSTSEQLANDVAWLVRSLGGKARVGNAKKRGYKDKDGVYVQCHDAYDVQIVLPNGSKVFYTERKQARLKASYEPRYLSRWIDSIEYSHDDVGHCVTVDAPDSLYLCNDFIVTHNTALVAWIIIWFMSTRPNCQCVVTANTQAQLSTKTWRELAKWHRMALNRHHFKWTATTFFHVLFPETWKANAIPWSEANSEAFAGTHELTGVLIVYDEASAIADVIWEVTEGAMTTPGAMWVVFGNPTRSSGRFYDCFNSHQHRWTTYKVDSRKAKVCNKVEVQKWVDDYGEDSDFVRVRVRGEFPRQAINQFISSDIVLEAMKRRYPKETYIHHRPVIGVDVARFGGDSSVIVVRQGPVVHPNSERFMQIDTMALAGKVVDTYRRLGNTGIICVDGVGVGAGVVDRLKQLGLPIIDVQSAAKSHDIRTYANRRSGLYGKFKDWLAMDGSLPFDNDLFNQIRVLEYQINNRLQIQLMSKDDIRETIGASPDLADAIAYTFAADEALEQSMGGRVRKVVNTTFV